MKQDDALLSELSDLLQDDVFQSALCASAGKCAFDTGSTLTEVSQSQPDSDQRPMIISGMHTPTRDRPYICDQDGCNKSFTRSSHLTRHKRTHTKKRPFACDQCNKSFSQSGVLTAHKRIHTGEKPFVCDQGGCHKTFTTSRDLIRHKRIHT
ncbi:C2H2-type zinc finger protein, partial [Sansalvadorimonas verongulae]|nr:C2H2-type zinc finger protein [Sansalvadorimonas verongulae]